MPRGKAQCHSCWMRFDWLTLCNWNRYIPWFCYVSAKQRNEKPVPYGNVIKRRWSFSLTKRTVFQTKATSFGMMLISTSRPLFTSALKCRAALYGCLEDRLECGCQEAHLCWTLIRSLVIGGTFTAKANSSLRSLQRPVMWKGSYYPLPLVMPCEFAVALRM